MAISVPVKDLSGRLVARLGLNEAVFGVDMNEAVVYQALVAQRANERRGTASTKTRGEVSGTTRKPWRQKHTGRARVGTRMSPLWRHGGVVFGPKPRSYAKALPRKMRRLAIRCLLSDKQRGSELSVVKELKLEGKSKEIAALFDALDIGTAGVLIVTKLPEPALMRGARNFGRVKTIPAAQISVGDLLKYQFLVMTVEAVRAVEQIWARQKIDRKRALGLPIEEEVIPEAVEEAVEPEPVLASESIVAEKKLTTGRPRKKAAVAELAAGEETEEEESPRPRRRTAKKTATRSRSTRAKIEPEAAVAEPAVEEKTEREKAPSPSRRRTTATTTTAAAGSRSRSTRAGSGPKASGSKPVAEKKPTARRVPKGTAEKGDPAS